MLLTEDEAKTKECRVAGTTGAWATTNQTQYGAPVRLEAAFPPCAASGCMHWRWEGPVYKPGMEPPNHVPFGFCGLAGRP